MVVNVEERMTRVIKTAQALQNVRRAQIDFLLNWTLDQAQQVTLPPRFSDLAPIDDTDKRDWRHLYDGSVLDD